MRTERRGIRLVAAAVIVCATAAGADVFKLDSGPKRLVAVERTGGETIYRAAVEINGGAGDLEVVGWRDSMETVAARLRAKSFGREGAELKTSGNASFGIVRFDGRVERVLLMDFGAGCVMFRLGQSQGEFERSSKSLPKPGIESVPACPASSSLFYVRNRDTGTEMELSRAAIGPAAARTAMRSRFEGTGWASPLARGAAARMREGIDIYARGDEICFMLVGQGEGDSESYVAVLRKKLRGRENVE